MTIFPKEIFCSHLCGLCVFSCNLAILSNFSTNSNICILCSISIRSNFSCISNNFSCIFTTLSNFSTKSNSFLSSIFSIRSNFNYQFYLVIRATEQQSMHGSSYMNIYIVFASDF